MTFNTYSATRADINVCDLTSNANYWYQYLLTSYY